MMSYKGFIGYISSIQNYEISKSLHDTYEETITDGVSFSDKGYTVIVSKEYVKNINGNDIELKIGKCESEDSDSMMLSIKLKDSSLEIIRDRWGVRNIYYFQEENGLYFSSDIRFLLALNLKNIREYDNTALIQCSTLGYIYDSGRTLFKNIKQLPRNHKLFYESGLLKIDTSIITGNTARFNSFDEAYGAFVSTFQNTVKDIKKINGKKAYLLSGGIDSSSIVLEAARNSDRIDTISFASHNNHDDVYYAGRLAEALKTNHIVIDFNEESAIQNIPNYLNAIENIELNGIFSPLGGYAYYLLCREVRRHDFDIVFPGEGADEILGGYYWQLTHPFGFVDKLKEKTRNTVMYDRVISLFPEIEEKSIYTKIAYYLLQGTALTNYHLSCVEHVAKSFNLFNYPVYMSGSLYSVVKDIPVEWLCDGINTKLLLRKYLLSQISSMGLSDLVNRKKLAMPSVVSSEFQKELYSLSHKHAVNSSNPFMCEMNGDSVNIFMLDVFHKYYTTRPLTKPDSDEWNEDLERIHRNESFIYW